MKLLGVNAGTTVCRTVDKVDIFGDNSCKALYRLDGNANDESGNYHGAETAITYGGGVYERGAVFNGSTSMSTIPQTFISTTTDNTAFSFSLWVKFNALPDATYYKSVIGTASSDHSAVRLSFSYVSAGLFSIYVLRAYNSTIYYRSDIATNVPLSIGVWYNFTLIYNIGRTASVYKDGALLASNVSLGTSAAGVTIQSILALGQYNANGSYNNFALNGSIDQVRIFNRAITATEVATLYAECEPTSTVSVDSNVLNQAVAHYKLDGNALDSTGNYNGTETAMTYADGRFGQAGVFNGSTSKVLSSNISALQPTISAWVRFGAFGSGHNIISLGNVTSADTGTAFMVRTWATGKLFVSSNLAATVDLTPVLVINQWYHIAVTYSGTTVNMYIDGVLTGTGTLATTIATAPATMGTFPIAATFTNCTLDQVRIYNKALTATDVTALYNEAIPTSTVDTVQPLGDTSVKAFYQFNGDATDATGVYNGIATGTPTYTAGKFGQALISSNTSTNYVSTASIPNGNIRTISVWIYPTALPTDATFHTLYGAVSSSAQTTNTAIIRYVSAGLYAIEVYFNVGDTRYYTTTNPQTAIALNTWTHFVFMIESDNKISVYKNGTLVVKSTATTSGSVPYTGAINLGQYNPNGSNNPYTFRGNIDQLRIFNKALTSAEAQAIYSESSYTKTTLPTVELDPFLDNSCKALYKFDNNCLDAYGQYDGTATNVTYGTGKFGQGITPTVSTGKVDIGYPLSALNNDISISIWAKMSSIPTVSSSGSYLFVAYGGNFRIVINSTQKIAFGIYDGTDRVISSTTTPATNTWYHITIVRSKTLGMGLYVDGKLEASNSITVNPTVFGSEIGFGAYTGRLGIAGIIDQVRFFNKALTPMEVASLYNETTPLEEPMHSLVDPFKDGSGKALYRLEGNALDESGNYNGTATSVTYGAGRFGRCGVFNGTSSQIVVPTLSPTMKSISFWASRDVVEATMLAIVGGADESWIGFDQSSSNMRVSINAAVGITLPLLSPTVANTLYHFVLSWESSTSIKLYRDGVLQSTNIVNGYQTTAITYIGRRGTALWHKGKLDQVRIFNRALTSTEVTTLYTEGA